MFTSDIIANVEKVDIRVALGDFETVMSPDHSVTGEDTDSFNAAFSGVTEGVLALEVVDPSFFSPADVVWVKVFSGFDSERLDVSPVEGNNLVFNVDGDVLSRVVEFPAASVVDNAVVWGPVVDPVNS